MNNILQERFELIGRLNVLINYSKGSEFRGLLQRDSEILTTQARAMFTYLRSLDERLKLREDALFKST